MNPVYIVLVLFFVDHALSRDFYMGMFKRNDFLVGADELYKARVPSRTTWAKYGKLFKCPITYFRVVDRLGTNAFPHVKILRGGLQKKYIVLLLSSYNRPISVNIYVGCENKMKLTPRRPPTTIPDEAEETTAAGDAGNDGTTDGAGAGGEGEATVPEGGDATEAGTGGDAEATETTAGEATAPE